MGYFVWHEGPVPEGMKMTQVYGYIFTKDGRLLIRYEMKKDKKVYSLGGGTIEDYDNGINDTLIRELKEEVNTSVVEPIYLGYQEVIGDRDLPPYAQVRMTGLIDEIGEPLADIDGGETYGRVLVSPKRAIELLNWGEIGQKQVEATMKVMKEKYGITEYSTEETLLNDYVASKIKVK